MKFLLISPKNRTIYNFRGDLLKEILKKGYEVVAVGPDLTDVSEIEKLGVRFECVPLKKNGMSILGDLKYLYNIFRLIKREKPDITLGYTIKPVIYGAIAAKMAGVKSINSLVTGLGYAYTPKTVKARLPLGIVSFLYQIGFACADRVIFQNPDDLKEFTQKRLVASSKAYRVNGSGVNMEWFSPSPLPEKPVFFMLSRLMYSKGVREYLAAAKAVKERFPDVRFILLGAAEGLSDSMTLEELSPYIKSGIIEYSGERPDVREYYKKCGVYVLPSSYREGIPRTVLEAMSMGRAIITTDAPGCRETVVNGYNGFMVPVKDVDSLVEKMSFFALNPEKIKEMGENSRRLCKERFEVGEVNAKMLEIMLI